MKFTADNPPIRGEAYVHAIHHGAADEILRNELWDRTKMNMYIEHIDVIEEGEKKGHVVITIE